jgi:hypothetical protein
MSESVAVTLFERTGVIVQVNVMCWRRVQEHAYSASYARTHSSQL